MLTIKSVQLNILYKIIKDSVILQNIFKHFVELKFIFDSCRNKQILFNNQSINFE